MEDIAIFCIYLEAFKIDLTFSSSETQSSEVCSWLGIQSHKSLSKCRKKSRYLATSCSYKVQFGEQHRLQRGMWNAKGWTSRLQWKLRYITGISAPSPSTIYCFTLIMPQQFGFRWEGLLPSLKFVSRMRPKSQK